jgi:hypothetical protein
MQYGEHVQAEQLHVLREALRGTHPERQPDWDEVAAHWFELIRPVWYERLTGRRQKPLLSKDIRRDLFANRERLAPKLVHRFDQFPIQPPPDERIRSCIIGVA